jgi:hypothetical protein
MGGVFFVPTVDSTPQEPDYHAYVWRHAFPDAVRNQLATVDNPNGTITNSDLELAGTIGQHDVVACTLDVRELTIHSVHDNSPTVFWNRKGSATTQGPTAYLLRYQALHQRVHRYTALHDFLPGHLNRMADDASRRLHLPDTDILEHFNTHFPQPRPWNLCQLRSETSSALISSLFSKRSEPVSVPSGCAQLTRIGDAGWNFVPRTIWTPTTPRETVYRTYRSSLVDSVMDASRPAANPFDLAQFLSPYETWDRRMHGWGPSTQGSTATATSTFD